MGIGKILYTMRFSLIIILSFVISFIVRRMYPKKSDIFHIILSFIISVVIILAFFKINLFLNPLNLYFPEVRIATIDNTNPKVKELTYNVDIINRTNKDLDVILTFTREDSELYPYINLIPETYTSDKITIKANERKDYVSSFTIDSEDSRLINSFYLKMKVKYSLQ